MAHELSESVQDPQTKRWKNVYGEGPKKGQPLPIQHAWERPEYGNPEEAVAAARLRSDAHQDGSPKRPKPTTDAEADFVNRYAVASHERQQAERVRRFDQSLRNMDLETLRQGPPSPPAEGAKKPRPPRGFLGDVWSGIWESLPITGTNYVGQVIGGGLAAVDEVIGTLQDIDGWLREVTGSQAAPLQLPRIPRVGEADTVTGWLVRSVSQFLTGMIPLAKLVPIRSAHWAARAAKYGIAGAAADAVVWDAHDPNVANLIEHLAPDVKVPLVQYLAVRPEDPRGEARFKRAIEGLMLGAAADTALLLLGRGLKAMKFGRERGLPTKPVAEAAGEVAGEAAEVSPGARARELAREGEPPAAAGVAPEAAVSPGAGARALVRERAEVRAATEAARYAEIREGAEASLRNFTGAAVEPAPLLARGVTSALPEVLSPGQAARAAVRAAEPVELRGAAEAGLQRRVEGRLPTREEIATGQDLSAVGRAPAEQAALVQRQLELDFEKGFGRQPARHEMEAGIVAYDNEARERLRSGLGQVDGVLRALIPDEAARKMMMPAIIGAAIALSTLTPEEAEAGIPAKVAAMIARAAGKVEPTVVGGFTFDPPQFAQQILESATKGQLKAMIQDATFNGAAHIWRGAKNFEMWKQAMLEDHGAGIAPYLDRQLFKQAKKYHESQLQTVRAQTRHPGTGDFTTMTTPRQADVLRERYRAEPGAVDFYDVTRPGAQSRNVQVFEQIWGERDGELMTFFNTVASVDRDPENTMRIARKMWADHLDGVLESNILARGQQAGYGLIPVRATLAGLKGDYSLLNWKQGNYFANLRGAFDRYTVDAVDLIGQGYYRWVPATKKVKGKTVLLREEDGTVRMKKAPLDMTVGQRKYIESKMRLTAEAGGEPRAKIQQELWGAQKKFRGRGGADLPPWQIAQRQVFEDLLSGEGARELAEALGRGEALDLGVFGRHGIYTARVLEEAAELGPRARVSYIAERLQEFAATLVARYPSRAAALGMKAAGTASAPQPAAAPRARRRGASDRQLVQENFAPGTPVTAEMLLGEARKLFDAITRTP